MEKSIEEERRIAAYSAVSNVVMIHSAIPFCKEDTLHALLSYLMPRYTTTKKLKRSKQLLDGCSEIYKKIETTKRMVSSAAERLVDSVFADLGLDVVKVAQSIS